MNEDKSFTKIRHKNMMYDGVASPSKVDDFVEKIYNSLLNEKFSIIEAETILKTLLSQIDNDKKLILREPLENVNKFKEGWNAPLFKIV